MYYFLAKLWCVVLMVLIVVEETNGGGLVVAELKEPALGGAKAAGAMRVIGYTHVSLMNDQSGDATLAAKQKFEHLAATRGVKVKHYNADNGRLAEQTFLSDIKKGMQRITFCFTKRSY